LKYKIAAVVSFSKLYLSSILLSIISQYLDQVSGINCQIHHAFESLKALLFKALSATAKYLKSSGIQASFNFSSIYGKNKDSLL
jgi:hypothetical protein